MVSRARRIPPKATNAHHIKGVEGMAGRERPSIGEHADVEVGQVERQQSQRRGMGFFSEGDGQEWRRSKDLNRALERCYDMMRGWVIRYAQLIEITF